MSLPRQLRPVAWGVGGLGIAAALAWGIARPAAVHGERWPNEPADFRPVVDQTWERLPGRWKLLWGHASVARETTAPFSPPSVVRIEFPEGFIGGAAPGTLALTLPRSRAVYAGIWWQASDPWQGHPSNSNKIAYLFMDPHGSMSLMMYGVPGGPYELRVFPDWHGEWLRPNVTNVPVTLGTWHRIEWLVSTDPDTDPAVGTVRWWMDGELLGEHHDVRLAEGPFIEYRIAPVWGGAEAVPKTESDQFLYGPARISVR